MSRATVWAATIRLVALFAPAVSYQECDGEETITITEYCPHGTWIEDDASPSGVRCRNYSAAHPKPKP